MNVAGMKPLYMWDSDVSAGEFDRDLQSNGLGKLFDAASQLEHASVRQHLYVYGAGVFIGWSSATDDIVGFSSTVVQR